MSLERLLTLRAEWIKRGEFLNKLTLEQHEAHRYFPTYYRVLADYELKIANAYEEETQDNCYPVEVKQY